MSMAHSLEVRVPLIDDMVVDYVLDLPSGWNSRYGYPKKLLVESCKDLLPPFLNYKKKQGFQLPMEVWLKKGLKDTVDEAFLSNNSSVRKIFNTMWLDKLLSGFIRGKYSYESVWKIVVLDLWAKKNDVELIPEK